MTLGAAAAFLQLQNYSVTANYMQKTTCEARLPEAKNHSNCFQKKDHLVYPEHPINILKI